MLEPRRREMEGEGEREVTRREREVRGGRRGDSVVESEGGRLRL